MLKQSNEIHMTPNKFLRYMLIIAGSIFLGLGIIGIFVPILPTTPFLLLAAACFAKSSKRFYTWLLSNKWFGTYIKNYRDGNGIPRRVKTITLLLLWTTIIFSVFFIVSFLIQIILIIIAIGVTIHILTIKTYKHKIS